ncbi:hypothetical protein GIW81_10945 [Hyphomicrobium sp. xq]|uniref:Uncharacterized protein n=1 Tax=Hyphomicrobium album TaxID=2665159 RepID=A0A6I3KKF9_9HYPH|nr:hypothetical protein [Hyphomicrobium album]MTD94848.1 hypothetical protein [Hyphomicrobium album]
MSEQDDTQRREYEERLQRRLKILKDEFEAGKIVIAPGLQVIESLKAVRYAADGTIDLSTVDGLVRSMALMAEHIHERGEAKKAASLREIQELYFNFLYLNFKPYFETMLKGKLTPHEAGLAISRSEQSRKEFLRALPDFMEAIEGFWAGMAGALHAHLEDMHGTMKCSYGGDIFPSHAENIASKCGLYADTIILPDPFLRSREIFANWSEEKSVYYLVKNAMNVLQYRELALANVEPPIVVISPDYSELVRNEKKFVGLVSESDCLAHASRIFGRKFESMDSLMEYAEHFDTLDTLLPEIKDPRRVLFDAELKGGAREHITSMLDDPSSALLKSKHPGVVVAASAFGRMAQANDLLIKSRRLGATPVIDAPTSWQYFVWKLEYDADRASEGAPQTDDLHVLRALESLSHTDMEWLGKVPPRALIELRESGALAEIRSIMAAGVKEVAEARPDNFFRSKDRVFENLERALDVHQGQLDALRAKTWKFAGKDIGTWVVTGTVAVSAALTGYPIFALAALAVDQVVDVPKLKDIPESIKELAKESKKLRQSPVGLLFSYRKMAER